MSTRSLVVVAATALLAAALGSAQASNAGSGRAAETVPRATSSIRVDGSLDEAAWEQALTLEVPYEVWPAENVAAPVRTQLLVTYDDKAVYFGFRAFDPDPGAIRAHLSDRDNLGGDDWVAVVLDTFNDERRAFDLGLNALGVQWDFYETRSEEGEWDAIWDGASKILAWGWSAEIRLPFSSLRFQRAAGPQIWGIDAVRSYPRRERHVLGLFSRDRSNACYLCQTVKIEGFEGVTPGKNLELTPTVTAIRSELWSAGASKSIPPGHLEANATDTDAGLTARWGFTPALTASATLNPDFSQVEADAVQLDVNEPFALSYAEKRPFFMEGSDFFKTRLDAVYTRTIRDPSWGLKLTGKEAGNTVGAFVVQDDTTNLLIPGSQYSAGTTLAESTLATVLRYRRDVGNSFTVGALASDREGSSYFNRMAGLDADVRFSASDRLQVQLLGASTRYPDATAEAFNQPRGTFKGFAADALFVHDTRTLDYWAMYRDIGQDFRADLGFVPRVDTRLGEVGAGYGVNSKGDSWFSSLYFQGYVQDVTDHDNDLLYRTAVVEAQYEGPLQSHAVLRLTRRRDAYNGAQFDRSEIYVHNCMVPVSGTGFHVNLTTGDQIDYANTALGRRLRVEPGISQRLGTHMSVDLSGIWERMERDGQRLYTANVAQTTVAYQFNTRSFVRAIVQYLDYDYARGMYTDGRDTRSSRLGSQLLFSYKLNPQTVLFLGYSDTAQGSEEYELTRTGRTMFAKVGYAWTM